MSWRFRRIFHIGPIRFTLEKTGIGVSIGTRGLHIGRSPSGKLYVSAGIPGTGLYWRKDLSVTKQESVDAEDASADPLENIPSPRNRREWERWKRRYREYMRKKLQQEGDTNDVKE